MNNIPIPGCYRHYKGELYSVWFVAEHSETGEPMVVYQAYYGEKRMYVRPASMWFEQVGVAEDGTPITRFTKCEFKKQDGTVCD